MNRRPTIVDIARRAGVSKSTVSLVLRGSPSVKEETRRLVKEAMTEIGYVYNRSAANLRSLNAGLIGLVINDLRNPFFTEFATSLQMSLSARGYAAVLANTDEDPALQAKMIHTFIEHGVSAFIISPAYGKTRQGFDAIARAGIPAIQVFRKVDPRVETFPFAAPDYMRGGRLATRHLLERGARRICFVGGLEGRAVTRERMSGYLAVVEEAGIAPLVLTGRASREFGREAAQVLSHRHPDVDGILCFNDLVAMGILAGCAARGRRVGSELLIVGIDDIEECRHGFPSLSSIRCGIPGFAENIAVQILDWVVGGTRPSMLQRTSVELIVRQSSGP
ncbi:MAG: LacI family DNA-binding transcriptional regulator [Pseudomonadota bacterium]